MSGKNAVYAILLIILAVFVSLGVSMAIGSSVQRDPLEVQAAELYKQIRCPVCEGQTIADSDAGPSPSMRFEVRKMLNEGRTPAEIKRQFAYTYGDWVLMEPPTRGAFVLTWWMPVLFLLIGFGYLWYFMSGKTRQKLTDPPHLASAGVQTGEHDGNEAGQHEAEPKYDALHDAELERELNRYL